MRALLTPIIALALSFGMATASPAEMTEAEREALHDEIRNYLLEHPEVLREAIGLLEQREAEAAAQAAQDALAANREAVFNDGFSFVGGNPEGSITMVEFIDYQCGFCKRAHGSVKELLASDGDIRWVVKEMPILGPMSVTAARAAKAVLQNDGPEIYEAFNDALLSFSGQLSETAIERLAGGIGANIPAMKAAMNEDGITDMLRQTRALAQSLQVTGTPTFIIGDEIVRGFLPLEELRAVVERERDAL